MGLDSVELIMELEKFFGIQIPNKVAENIYTVQNAVDSISSILNISQESSDLKKQIFRKIQTAIQEYHGSGEVILESDLVCRKFPVIDKSEWNRLSTEIGLTVPYPHKDSTKEISFWGVIGWEPKFNFKELTFSQLTDVVCAANFEKLIDSKFIATKYEVYISIIAITVDKIGVSFYEVKPEKVFTNDFGID